MRKSMSCLERMLRLASAGGWCGGGTGNGANGIDKRSLSLPFRNYFSVDGTEHVLPLAVFRRPPPANRIAEPFLSPPPRAQLKRFNKIES